MNKEDSKAISELIKLNVEMAYMAYTSHEDDSCYEAFGIGCLLFVDYITKGLQAILDMQRRYYDLEVAHQCDRECIKEQDEFMADIFGEYNVDEITDENYEKLHDFVRNEILHLDEDEE